MSRLSNRARSADRVSPRAWSDGRFTIDDMVELFAEAFLESLQEPDHQEPEHRYDEDRSLCVLATARCTSSTPRSVEFHLLQAEELLKCDLAQVTPLLDDAS